MAREALTVIGTVVGAFYGNPQLGYAIGAFVGGLVDPEQINAPSIGDIANQTSAEGVPCPLLAGTAGCAGNLIYRSDPRVVKGDFQSGKGGPEVQDPDRVYRTYAIRIGASLFDGPGNRVGVTGVRKIWEDEKLVYDVSPESVILAESAAYANGFTFYPGNETQLPDPDIEAIKGVGNVSAYRGRCYIVFKNKDLTDRRGSVPQHRFEVTIDADIYSPVTLATNLSHYSGTPSDLVLADDPIGWTLDGTIGRVSLSPDGIYCAASAPGFTTGRFFEIRKYDIATESWSAVADPVELPEAGPGALVWSPDGNFLFLINTKNTAENWFIYERDGDTFTKVPDPAEFMNTTARSGGFDVNGERIVITNANTGNSLGVYPFLGPSGFGDLIDGFAAAGGEISVGPKFRPIAGDRYVALRTATRLLVVDVSANPITQVASLTIDVGAGHFWLPGGDYIIGVPGDTANQKIQIIAFDSTLGSEALTLVGESDVAFTGAVDDCDLSADGRYLVLTRSTVSTNYPPQLFEISLTAPPAVTRLADPPGEAAILYAVSWRGTQALPQLTAGTTTFEQVVLAAGRRCKMPNSAWSIANQASKIVRGSVVASQNYTAQDYINSLRLVFPCDGAVYDGLIRLPSRGGAVVRELDEQFMVWEGDDLEQEETLRNGDDKRQAPIRRPLKINLMFPNADVGYQLTKATSPNYGDRGDAVNESTLEIPIVLDPETEAPQLADILDKISRADAEGEIVRVFPENLAADLVPGSVVRLTGEGGLVRRLRVESTRVGDCTKRLLMRVDRVHANTSQLTSQPGPVWPTPPPSLPGETTFVVMNLPILLDAHDTLGVYFAMSGQPGTAWNGAFVDYRVQGATSWTSLGLLTRRAIMGELLASFSAASEFYTDTTNVLQVRPIDPEDEIESLTDEEWLSERNPAAIVYPDGTAEIIQPRDADQDSEGDWSLTHHQRGRLNTQAGPHAAGATFVMLDGAIFVPLPSALIGQVIEFRVTTAGTSSEEASIYTLEWDPVVVQSEFPIADLSLSLVSGFVEASWSPRLRMGTEDSPISSINLTGYRFEATDGVTTKVTDPVVGTTHSVDASFFTGSVTVTVRPINRFTGLGPAIAGTIDI